MALSKLQIVNLALSRIGEPPLATLSDSRPAKTAMDTVYDNARTSLLAMAPWPWAMKKTALVESSDELVDGWAYSYAIPSDCLRPFAVTRSGDSETLPAYYPLQWEQVGDRICADEPGLFLRYVYDAPAERFPPDVANVFTVKLASAMAPALTRDLAMASALDQRFNAEIQLVMNRALKSDRRTRNDSGDYLAAREGGYDVDRT